MRMMPPQAVGQCQHAYFFSSYLMTLTSLMALPLGKWTSPAPPQFLTGESPLMAALATPAQVPNLRRWSAMGPLASLRNLERSWRASSGLATDTLALPATTMALRRLLPMTAPMPERPAARPLSFMTQEMSESFSP